MNLGSLKPANGAVKARKRVGRGNASGYGKTSGRGHKGYHSRSGSKRRPWHEGGTMPIYRRLPKRGFTNIFKEELQIVNLDKIAALPHQKVDIETLYAEKLVKSVTQPVKILGRGKIEKAMTVTAHVFSKTAREKIEAAGGKATVI